MAEKTPIKKFSAGAISIAIWENNSLQEEGRPYFTVSMQKRFKNKENEWQNSNSFRLNDLPKAMLVLQKAFEYLALKEQSETI